MSSTAARLHHVGRPRNRTALATGGAAAALTPATAQAKSRRTPLRFDPAGHFTIVQFNDTQDDEKIDRRTVELIEKVLDREQPDLVVLNGANITGNMSSLINRSRRDRT